MRRVEAVTQLRAPAERESLTPLRRRSESFHNLPLQLTRFVGRESEQAELLQLLEVERLVTLTGTGGIGKSRLAVELSGSLIHSYRDGVWLVELASLQESDLVVQSISEQVGVRAETGTAEQALLEFLRGRQLLLVLDNCEHLIQACASITEAILRTCPAVQILATSREPLHIAGETSWRVPPLSVPDAARHASRQLLEAEAVRLFADRAQASAGLVVNAANAESVAKICQQLDGIPLAIELAAARARVLSVEQIASRLDNRFRLLIGGGRTAPLRQQTLRAAIDWSYELLSTAERRVLGWLSVFAGGFTLEAAERACATESTPAEDVFDLLARLVDKSLVQAEPGSGGQLRYRLLESVRVYAHEQLLAGGDAATAARRHCAYYAELAQQAEKHLLWGSGALDWLARLDRELPNLRAALAWSLSEGGEPGMALKLAGQLGHYWYTRADRAEGRAWLKRALAHAASGNSTDASSCRSVRLVSRWECWAIRCSRLVCLTTASPSRAKLDPTAGSALPPSILDRSPACRAKQRPPRRLLPRGCACSRAGTAPGVWPSAWKVWPWWPGWRAASSEPHDCSALPPACASPSAHQPIPSIAPTTSEPWPPRWQDWVRAPMTPPGVRAYRCPWMT